MKIPMFRHALNTLILYSPCCVFHRLVVDCGRQNAPANGRISGNVFSYGATISHTCNVGYALTGSEFRTCQANGQFSGVAPACVGEAVWAYSRIWEGQEG